MQIVQKCGGLPLAIKAMGGLLRMKGTYEDEWKDVLKTSEWLTSGGGREDDALDTALSLSYEDLRAPVKQCFLYYSLLPQYTQHSLVIGMWKSEGFLDAGSDDDDGTAKDAEDRGLDYHKDLIQRNLIEPDYIKSAQGEICRMHIAIRDFARLMAKEEALVVGPLQGHKVVSAARAPDDEASSSSSQGSRRIRRLSVEPSPAEAEAEAAALTEWRSITLGKHESLRSLIIDARVKFDDEPTTARFPSLLRALYLKRAESDRLVTSSLCDLRHLRFICLCSTDISRLPDNMGDKLKFLEHFEMEDCPSFSGQLPSSFPKLQRLRHLVVLGGTKFVVPRPSTNTNDGCGLHWLTNLKTLREYPAQATEDGRWCSLEELAPLNQLETLCLRDLDGVPSGSGSKAELHRKEQLKILKLTCFDAALRLGDVDIDEEVDARRLEEVFEQLCPPPGLRSLGIGAYPGLRLPTWTTASRSAGVLGCLRDLSLWNLPFCAQLPDGLCLLPNLNLLAIDTAVVVERVGPEFVRSISSSRSFPALSYLRLKELPMWAEWEWEKEDEDEGVAMPSLNILYIQECNLRCLPAGLASSRRTNLRQLVLSDIRLLESLDNFPSFTVLDVRRCPALRTIRSFPRMEKLVVYFCTGLEVVDAGPPALDTMELFLFDTCSTLPEYIRGVRPKLLLLNCGLELHGLLVPGPGNDTAECAKVAQIDKIVVTPIKTV